MKFELTFTYSDPGTADELLQLTSITHRDEKYKIIGSWGGSVLATGDVREISQRAVEALMGVQQIELPF